MREADCGPAAALTYRVLVSQQPRRVHRTANFRAFLITGGLVGFLVGVAVVLFGRSAPDYGRVQILGFFGVCGAALGALLAGVVAVLLDRRL